ncbi:unnamed protein product [Rotaria magnacalcarata]|uniref:Integrase catalytic domain-containing protein n=3 Tax=Rotaria magnacalcarata TaxID=392030 RepID=A0A816Z5T9_9BILA|nr:unnamed protein product [Rotaria magnacalcarata]CAF4190655.1 unnamed protein product [Rotaria magnacalcarata]
MAHLVTKTFKIIEIKSIELVYDIKKNLPLITFKNLYEKIKECHVAVGHSDRDKTWSEVKRRYAGIPQQAIDIYIRMCDAYQTRRSILKPACGKPILSVGFLTRLQVDLIDMHSVEHNGFKFIIHVKNHFTKFSWLFALPSKEANNVATHLRNIFYTFGPPKILQSDNGKECVAKIILELKSTWSNLIIINGRPSHPQSQGLVERANTVVQKMLGPVMLAINNCVSQSTQNAPYEMVFGQSVHTNDEFWLEVHKQYSNSLIINEGELPESICQILSLNHGELTTKDSSNTTDDFPIPLLSSDTCLTNTTDNTTQSSHKRIRDEAEKCYILTAERQYKNYQVSVKKQKKFQINDIVGLKISEVDRTNTSASILPCKIVDVLTKEDSLYLQYKLATLDGIINDWFSSVDIIDLSETLSAELRQLDTKKLSNVTFIQVCQIFSNFKSTDTCKCTGSCDINRCPYTKRSILCCSKCHRGKCSDRKNIN